MRAFQKGHMHFHIPTHGPRRLFQNLNWICEIMHGPMSVSGTAVDQVEAISAALERDLSQHSATGGDTVRFVLTGIISSILLMSLGIGGTYCV
jgi:hypothetical protein